MTPPPSTAIGGGELAQIAELLDICEQYLRHAPTTAHADLDDTLRARGITGGPGWLIDMLGLTAVDLRARTRALATCKENPDE